MSYKKILLINPPYNRLKGSKEFYWPIGLGYLSSYLKNRGGFDTKIYNVDGSKDDELLSINKYYDQVNSSRMIEKSLKNDKHLVWKEVKDVLKDFKPDIIGISVMSAKYELALKIASLYKNLFNKGVVVFGGPHPTIEAKKCLKNREVDFVCIGEGEETFLELSRSLRNKGKKFRDIKGLAYKSNNKIIQNELREPIIDLDKLPFPDRDSLFFKNKYDKNKFAVIITSRGCPYRCGYCAAKTIWGRKIRYRSITNVINELKYIVNKYNLQDVFFWDDSFSLNKKRIIELCYQIIKNKLNIMWSCTTRVNLVDEKLLRIMKKAGCRSIDFGVESGSRRMIKLIHKDITIKEVKKALELTRKNNIMGNVFFMVGFPDETLQDINDTIKLINSLYYSRVCFSIFTPYPHTLLYERAKKLGLIPLNLKWYKYSHQSENNNFNNIIPKKDFKKIIKRLAKLVDKHNNSLSLKLMYLKSIKSYYIKNPQLIFGKILTKINFLKQI